MKSQRFRFRRFLRYAQKAEARLAKPVDVLRSSWACTLEPEPDGTLSLRFGFGYVRGLRQAVAQEIEAARALRLFASIEELARRVPSLSRVELAALAELGALNPLGHNTHRRSALWQAAWASRKAGALLDVAGENQSDSPLEPMTGKERLVVDHTGSGVTVGRHPVAHHCDRLRQMCIRSAHELRALPHGAAVRITGYVIARQRPGTAHGFIFLLIEDETGIANAITGPDLYERHRALITYPATLLITGVLQNIDHVIHLRAKHVEELHLTHAPVQSHDFQ